ncbi:MAG: hypothetical protein GY909_15670 [Oligoflexia bacterium]|nr:hypothetical protein [Oligoflexia bacterium]
MEYLTYWLTGIDYIFKALVLVGVVPLLFISLIKLLLYIDKKISELIPFSTEALYLGITGCLLFLVFLPYGLGEIISAQGDLKKVSPIGFCSLGLGAVILVALFWTFIDEFLTNTKK